MLVRRPGAAARSRAQYEVKLAEYFQQRKAELSPDSVSRLEKGAVLRILDSKNEGDRAVVAGAPSVTDYLTTASATRFAQVLDGIQGVKVPYVVEPSLVRGLDYYCHTTFEFKVVSEGNDSERLGTVLAGGRYNGLLEQFGAAAGTGGIGACNRLTVFPLVALCVHVHCCCCYCYCYCYY